MIEKRKQRKQTSPEKTSQSKITTPKTTTAKLLRPRALKNNKNVLEVHLPTLISSFISENGIQTSFKNQIISAVKRSRDGENDKMKQIVKQDIESNQEGRIWPYFKYNSIT